MEKNSHYFYVLECADGSYYGGYTADLKRIKAHNDGKGQVYEEQETGKIDLF